jgi:hypothetical protein
MLENDEQLAVAREHLAQFEEALRLYEESCRAHPERHGSRAAQEYVAGALRLKAAEIFTAISYYEATHHPKLDNR